MSPSLFNTIAASFGRSLGLADLAPDGDGYLALSFDDLPVHLQYDWEEDSILAFARLGTIDEDRREEILAWMMGANLFWQGAKGATLAAEPVTDMVFVQNRIAGGNVNDEAFRAWLGTFVDMAHYWRGRLEAANRGEALEEESAGERPAPAADADAVRLMA